jgi:hypothetical protein
MLTLNKYTFALSLSIYIFGYQVVIAQSIITLCEVIDPGTLSLNHQDSVYLYNLTNISTVVDYKFVKLLNPITSQSNGVLRFSFNYGDLNDTLMSFASDVKYYSSNNYVWKGIIADDDGDIRICKDSNGVFGSFVLDTIRFDFYSFNDSISIRLEHASHMIDPVDDIADTTSIEFNRDLGDCQEDNDCAAEMRILVLLPSDAQT